MRRTERMALRASVACAGLIFGVAGGAPGQVTNFTTNAWTVNANGSWTNALNWNPNVNFPDAYGAVAYVTNNVSGGNRILYVDTSVTVGALFWGDFDRGNQIDIRTTNAVPSRITFNTGDGGQALLVHGTGDRAAHDFGNGGDDIDTGIDLTDPDGLLINSWQTLVFNGRAGAIGTEAGRSFDGGGYDITKVEDGAIIFRNILTNVGNVFVRDGEFRVDMEGNPLLKPGISNVVIGVAPGVIDRGVESFGVITNTGEGSADDRVQFARFSIVGANNTNTAFAGQVVTNAFEMTIERGWFQSLYRPQTNGVPTVYAGGITLIGDADEVIIQTENQGFSGNISSVVQQTIFAGKITGPGGFTKIGSGEMTLVASNDFTGALNINRPSDTAIGDRGGVRLQENGTLSGVSEIVLNRAGNLFVDNRALALSNRINDGASLVGQGRSHVEFVGNASAATYEQIGAVTSRAGSLSFEFDKDNASPQSQTLELASLTRAPGSVVNFTASDLRQGVFGLDGPTGIVVRLLDGGASLTQVGSGGGVGAVNRSVAVGVFGGDGSDFNANPTTTAPNRSDEFMTYDGGRLRTLDPLTEMVSLGNRLTNALNITQASAGTDANVNIDFQSTAPVIQGGGTFNTNLIDKRVTESATFNSIRFGIVPGPGANDFGRSLVMDDGVRLRSESGMLLLGRDTGSTTGDTNPVGNVLLYGGLLDLDGANNDREAIIHNSSGNSFFLRSQLEAGQGLTKSGAQRVYLDNDNNVGGIVNVAQGELQLRSSGAVGGASEIRLAGDGRLFLSSSIAVTNVDLRVGPRDASRETLFSEAQHNVFGGDILIENVDPLGMILYEVRLRSGNNNQNATLSLLGDIGISVTSSINPDLNLNDPQLLAVRDGGGIINLKGTVGDRIVDGEALPIDPTAIGQSRLTGGFMSNRAANENEVLRFLIDGPSLANSGDELNVNIYRPWNAVGRINAAQGTVRFLGDPTAGEGSFWTSNALAVSDFGHGFGGFVLGGLGSGESDRNSSTTFLLTRDGQAFNAERWTVANDNNGGDFTATMGLEHFGPSNATVTIGNEFQDNNPGADDNRITINGTDAAQFREFRLFAHDGYDAATGSNSVGRVNVIQSIRGNDFSMLTVVGNGVVALQGQTNAAVDEANQIRHFTLLGGELLLDRSVPAQPADIRRTHDGLNPTLTLAGGDVAFLSRAGQTEVFSSNLTVRAGDSRVEVRSQSGVADLAVATGPGASVTRQAGGTVQFTEDNTAGGTAQIRLAGAGVAVGGRVGSWATYGTNYRSGAFTWASTDASSNVVEFSEGGYSVNSFGAANHVHLDGAPPVFVTNDAAASLRYTNATALDLGGWGLNVVEGGILVTPTVAGAASIGNGQLTSSGGELIVHNYADASGGLAISAAITGAVDLTHSGTGKTTLSGANSYTGVTYLNGGTLEIDSASRLGSGNANLEMRGGTLATTASMFLSNRTVILGGDGGTFQVAGGTTNVLGVVRSEAHFLDAERFNIGHGDLIKTGAGTLELGINPGATNNLTAGFNLYQGLTDIREGELRLTGTGNYLLGSNKSFYDGTVVRGGATLTLGSTAPALLAAGITNSYSLQEWIVFEQGSTLRVEDPAGGYQSPSINGVVDFRGDTTVFVQADEFNFNSSGAGYVMGDGAIVKTGGGALRIYEYSPDFTGDLVIRQGDIQVQSLRSYALPNAGTIILGTNGTSNPGAVVFTVRPDRDDLPGVWEINSDIVALGNSSDMRLRFRRPEHNDVAIFNGGIDLSGYDTASDLREFRFEIMDTVDGRDAVGATEYREDAFMVLAGDITGGNKRIRTMVSQEGTGNRDLGSQTLSNQFDIFAFFDFRGSNAGWTGSLEVGNRTSDNDLDRRHFVRFGNDDGLASLAVGASNAVVLRHDATLQSHGGLVTVGNLYSDGDSGGGDGYFGSQLVTNSFVENGGTVAGTLTVFQTVSNATFNAVIRDGTYYSPLATNLPSAALNLVKDGAGVFNTVASNYYTGTTLVRDGLLRVNGAHTGGGLYTIDAGGTLGGTGLIQSAGVVVLDAGTLAPGNSPGTLTVNANLAFSNSAILSFELNASNMVAGLGINDLVTGVNDLRLDGILNVAWAGNILSEVNDGDYWTLFQYGGLLEDYGVDLSSLPDISGLGLYWYIDTVSVANTVGLAVVIPEPSTWALLALGMGVVVGLARRRR